MNSLDHIVIGEQAPAQEAAPGMPEVPVDTRNTSDGSEFPLYPILGAALLVGLGVALTGTFIENRHRRNSDNGNGTDS